MVLQIINDVILMRHQITSPKIRHQNDVTKFFHFQAPPLSKILVALLHVPLLSPSPLIATPLGAKAKTVHLLSLLYYSILILNQISVTVAHCNLELHALKVLLRWVYTERDRDRGLRPWSK